MLTDPFHGVHMGVTAENVAREYGVSRDEQDEFALESQRRAATAAARAAFADEIVAVDVDGRKPFTVEEDEHPKPDTTLDALAGLRPAFSKDGTVTAGNASGINDGAAALILARQGAATERGLSGLVSLEAFASQAVAVIRDSKLDPLRVNPYGGAIALGHPVGATGANLVLRLAKDMVRRDLELGIVSMCIGGGQALAALFRRV
ncbi:thiolase family protein [Nocardioidaceae bacterium SCSIO 66511]|nr:thiolase family protein [Nocardioidaceae bacterium SCSIO 66511]